MLHVQTSPIMVHPMGTKATKRKAKTKVKKEFSNFDDLTTMEEIIKSKVLASEDLARVKHGCNRLREKEIGLHILFKDC